MKHSYQDIDNNEEFIEDHTLANYKGNGTIPSSAFNFMNTIVGGQLILSFFFN